jgi:polysaccharide export outer membrane protein
MIGTGLGNQQHNHTQEQKAGLNPKRQSLLPRKIRRSANGLTLLSLMMFAYWPLPGIAQTTVPTLPTAPTPVQPLQPGTAVPRQPNNLAPLQPGNLAPLQPGGSLAPPPQTVTPAQLGTGYILGSGDRLRLDIFNVPEYSGEQQVLSDGTLNLPLIGKVVVQGLTLQQASDVLTSKFATYLKRPVITLSLLAARPISIAIAGEVSRPGSYTVSLTGDTGIPTVTRAIQLAGGITQSADIGSIQVRRPQPRNSGPDQILSVNLWQLLQAGDRRQDLLLRDGDSVIIPTSTGTNLTEAPQLAAASFAANENRPLKIAVVGEVLRPGPYTVTGEVLQNGLEGQTQANGTTVATTIKRPTLTRAIQVAGGITQSANIRRIEVRRATQAGEKVIDIDLWKLLKEGDLNQDLALQEGDTIVIPTVTALDAKEATEIASASFSPNQITVNVVGEVSKPGAIQVPPNTPLNQAILTAGGFTPRARRASAELVRLNPDGTVTKRNLDIDFTKGVTEANNPALRNNDTVVIGRSGVAGVSDTLSLFLAPITGALGLIRLLTGGF